MKIVTRLAGLFLGAATATSALAHAALETQTAAPGSYYKGVVQIGHGCSGQATLAVHVEIPEGVISVKPMPKAGWTLETETGAYAGVYDNHGRSVTEGVRRITWTGELPDAHYDEFVFRARLTDGLEPGTTLWFKTVQECADGKNAWVEIPEEGQDPHDLDSPAPGLKLIAPNAHAHH
ncbi:MAG: YcnI family protein [Mameliella sp.]|nr:YcnI family protein [Mameliella sp.]